MIRLSDDQRRALESHAAAAFPLECCGVLLGQVEEGVKIVHEARALPNTFEPDEDFEQSVPGGTQERATEPVGQERRFMVAPETMFQLMREERSSGVKILGFYHSHPNHPAAPSGYDLAWSMPWYSYMIVSVINGEPAELTSWIRAEDGTRFDNEQIVSE